MNQPERSGETSRDRSKNVDNLSRQVAEALSLLGSRLLEVSETASLDASVLLAHVLGKSRSWVLAHPEAALNPQQVEELKACLVQLEQGEPLPYLLGHWEFYGLDFDLSPEVLIPRPETELLVEQALTWLQSAEIRQFCRVADVGTGSGCIAVSLAVHQPGLQVLATDISLPALQIARRNARKQHVQQQIAFLQSDLLAPFCGNRTPVFDLICANLPYIPTRVLHELPVYRREPGLALDGGPDGLVEISSLIEQATTCLRPGGLLLAEIEASQGNAVRDLACQFFPSAQVEVLQDISGRDRLLWLERLDI